MAHTIDTKLGGPSGAASRPLGAFAKVRRIFVKSLNKLIIWQERIEQRQALLGLDDRMLKDIGVGAVEAYREARKPFWLP